MRIDKYLKLSRILKRRTVSKELALHQRVEINGKVVKPAHEVKTGDLVTVTYGNRQMTIRVLATPEVVRKNQVSDMYEVVEEKRLEEKLFEVE